MSKGWIGVDLDGTLAHYEKWNGDQYHIGEPIPAMVDRVKLWLAEGKQVRIFTARVAHDKDGKVSDAITQWCRTHIGHSLPVVCCKDYSMVQLWDDRAVHVVPNTGEPCCNRHLNRKTKVATRAEIKKNVESTVKYAEEFFAKYYLMFEEEGCDEEQHRHALEMLKATILNLKEMEL